MEETLTNLENIFLQDKPFICGNEITIADLLGVCEVRNGMLFSCDVDIQLINSIFISIIVIIHEFVQ